MWTTTLRRCVFASVFAGVGFGIGFAAHAVLPKVRDALSRVDHEAIARDATSIFRDDFHPAPRKVACPHPEKVMVAVLLGQSNAANHGETLTKAGPQVVTFYRGTCYEASDPLLGASGKTGSVWPRFGDEVISSGAFDAVVLVPAAVGSSRMESWAPGGVLSARTEVRLSELKAAGYQPTHFLIQQGESEGHEGADPQTYRRDAERLLVSLKRTGAKVVLATTSRCMEAQNLAIREAQAGARAAAAAAVGPDADQIPNEHRINGCHYDDWAQRQMAKRWAAAVAIH